METSAEGQAPRGPEIARRFHLLLNRFRRGDGEAWRAVEIEAATGGRVSSSYISGLKRGKYRRPGVAHLVCIADAMGFPHELWWCEPEEWDGIPGGRPPEPLDEVVALDPRERAVVRVMRGFEERRKEAVVALVRQMEVL